MSEQCGAYRYGTVRCGRQSKKMALDIIPLCKSHLDTFQRNIRAAEDRGLRNAMSKYIDSKVVEAQDRRDAALVYFVKAGRRIKIGQSLDPELRVKSIRSGSVQMPKGLDPSNAKLLATEPGGQRREQELHRQFAHLRVAGEWFNNGPELKIYISELTARAA
jgi:hypothetical protein